MRPSTLVHFHHMIPMTMLIVQSARISYITSVDVIVLEVFFLQEQFGGALVQCIVL